MSNLPIMKMPKYQFSSEELITCPCGQNFCYDCFGVCDDCIAEENYVEFQIKGNKKRLAKKLKCKYSKNRNIWYIHLKYYELLCKANIIE